MNKLEIEENKVGFIINAFTKIEGIKVEFEDYLRFFKIDPWKIRRILVNNYKGKYSIPSLGESIYNRIYFLEYKDALKAKEWMESLVILNKLKG